MSLVCTGLLNILNNCSNSVHLYTYNNLTFYIVSYIFRKVYINCFAFSTLDISLKNISIHQPEGALQVIYRPHLKTRVSFDITISNDGDNRVNQVSISV